MNNFDAAQECYDRLLPEDFETEECPKCDGDGCPHCDRDDE